MRVQRLHKILLHDEGASQALDIEEVAGYLRRKLTKLEVEVRGNPFLPFGDRALDYARKVACIKIQDPAKMLSGHEPLYGEIEHERRRILGKTRACGVLYDGLALQRIFCELISREERSLEFVHIFFTNRLFATWEENDRRYHARVSIYGVPSIISTTGVVEAPAKPREYYLLKQQYRILGRDPLELKTEFIGRFIDYDDKRLTEVLKGYAIQAVIYALTGEPFCKDKGCRLYNAHWQEELMSAQLESEYEFCPQHKRIMEEADEHRSNRDQRR